METKQSYPKLRSVRFKSGGYLRVMPNVREKVSNGLWNDLMDIAEKMWATHEDRVAGFALVAWTADGNAGGHVQNEPTSPHPMSQIPGIVTETVRDVLTKVRVARFMRQDDNEDGAS